MTTGSSSCRHLMPWHRISLLHRPPLGNMGDSAHLGRGGYHRERAGIEEGRGGEGMGWRRLSAPFPAAQLKQRVTRSTPEQEAFGSVPRAVFSVPFSLLLSLGARSLSSGRQSLSVFLLRFFFFLIDCRRFCRPLPACVSLAHFVFVSIFRVLIGFISCCVYTFVVLWFSCLVS